MAVSSVDKLAEKLGKMTKDTLALQEQVSPDDVDQQQLGSISHFELQATAVVNSLTYDTSHSIGGDGLGFPVAFPVSFDSGIIYIYPFVIDHPVYGDLDSNVLWIDGGWLSEEVTIPITMPLTIGIVKTELYREEY